MSSTENQPSSTSTSTEVAIETTAAVAALNESGTQCDLYKELTREDEEIIKSLNLSEEIMSLKNSDTEKFWQHVCEHIRKDLETELKHNEELHNFHELLIDDQKDLLKRKNELRSLSEQARGILAEYANQAVDDSGIN